MVPFADAAGRRVGLVYLYKQGTFYAFAPQPGEAQVRDNLLEISVRDQLHGRAPDGGRPVAVVRAVGSPGTVTS